MRRKFASVFHSRVHHSWSSCRLGRTEFVSDTQKQRRIRRRSDFLFNYFFFIFRQGCVVWGSVCACTRVWVLRTQLKYILICTFSRMHSRFQFKSIRTTRILIGTKQNNEKSNEEKKSTIFHWTRMIITVSLSARRLSVCNFNALSLSFRAVVCAAPIDASV